MSDTVGVEIAPGRFTALAGVVRRIIDDPQLIGSIAEIAESLRDATGRHRRHPAVDRRSPTRSRTCSPTPGSDSARRTRCSSASPPTSRTPSSAGSGPRRSTGRAIEQLDIAIEGREGYVAFVSGSPDSPRLELAPLDVGPTMARGRVVEAHGDPHQRHHPDIARRHGSASPPTGSTRPTSGARSTTSAHSMLYCALAPARPERDGFRAAVHDELEALITAAGGSHAGAVHELAVDGRGRRRSPRRGVPFPILTQRDLPKPALREGIRRDQSRRACSPRGTLPGHRRARARRCRSW